MKNAVIGLVLAAAIVETVFFIRQQGQLTLLREQNRELTQQVADLEKQKASHAVAARPKAAPRPAPAPAVETEMAKIPARPVAPAPPAVAETATRDEKPAFGKFLAGMGSMMTNPAMKEMVRSQARMQLDMRYERLIKFFNLTPEAAEKFKALLMDRQMAMMDSGFAFMDQNMSDEDRKAHAEKMRRTTEDYAQQLKDLLGPENYESFQQYEQTEPERMQVDMFKHSLAGGDALTEQQEYDLVNAMYKVRSSSHSSLLNRNPNDPPDPETFTEEGIKAAMADMKKMNEEYAKAAQAILSPAQFASYQRHAEQQQAMQEMGMKFAAQMFGGDKADAKPK